MSRAIGIDISHWDGTFDPSKASAQIDFVIQKATEGTGRDIAFEDLYEGVSKVGIRGAYHYLRSGIPWTKQAAAFLNTVSGKDFHFYVIDIEEYGNVMDSEFASMSSEWLNYIKVTTGKPVLLYSNPNVYQTVLMVYDSRCQKYPFWVAQYPYIVPDPNTGQPRMPKARSDWTFWQYTANAPGSQYGVTSKSVDLNVFNGTLAELQVWAGAVVTPPPPSDVVPLAEWAQKVDEFLRTIGYNGPKPGGNSSTP